MASIWTRRWFIQVTTVGLCAGMYAVGRLLRRSKCLACGATGVGHAHRERGLAGVYCPNCGINVTRGLWDVDRPSGNDAMVSMDIPFPNRKLVIATDKPAVSMADFRL
jgi:hypothetical protein